MEKKYLIITFHMFFSRFLMLSPLFACSYRTFLV